MFNLSKELFFSVPFYYYNIENTDELNRELVHHILKIKEEDEQGLVRSNNLGWHSETNLSSRDEFNQITKIIHDALNKISTDEEYSSETNLVIENMWAIVSPKYAYNSQHFHPHSLWSGVYYVQCPPNCGNIRFSNKDAEAMWLPLYEKNENSVQSRQPHQWASVVYEAIEGRLIIFPSHVGHEVLQNLTDVEGEDGYRIALSFNSIQIKKEK